MKRLAGWTFTVLCLATTLGVAGVAGTQTVLVDCDAGDNLAKALSEADKGGPSHIRILGTCRGNFRIESAGVDLRGDGPETSVIEGSESGPALQITATEHVVIRGIAIRDGTVGVRILGNHSDVAVFSSRIQARNIGVWVSGLSEAYLNDVELVGSGGPAAQGWAVPGDQL